MIRFLIIAILIYIGYRWLKGTVTPVDKQESSYDAEPGDAELIQDPHCGTYFLKQRGVSAVVEGRMVHFCSAACRDEYIKGLRDH